MSQLLIEIDNPADEALIVQLVDRLKGRVLSKTDMLTPEERKQRLKNAMDKLVASNAAACFGDASE